MNVLVIFEQGYAGNPSDAVWIIDSVDNRAWFEQHSAQIDQNSAVFNPDSDVLAVLWSVFEHHPGWTAIMVSGVEMTRKIYSTVADEALVQSETPNGFSLKRID